jgi:hypothetical protein
MPDAHEAPEVMHWLPNLPAAGSLFGLAFILFAAHKPMP